jgi:putative adhesin
MKRTLALMGLTTAVCALVCAQDTGNRVVVPARNGSRPRMVEATLVHGSITVKAASGSDVIAELPGYRPRTDSRVPPGMHRIDSPWRNGIQVEETGDVVHILVGMAADQPDLLVTVPTNTSLKVHTTHGDLTVTGVHGEIDAATTHGDIVLNNVGGTVLANTVHGLIKVSMDQVDQSKPLSFSTLSGSIDVTLPADVKMNLKLKADHGDIWSDFDVKLTGGGAMTQPSGRVDGRYRVVMDRGLRGTINGGGVEASLYTVNGRITIHKK